MKILKLVEKKKWFFECLKTGNLLFAVIILKNTCSLIIKEYIKKIIY